MVDFDGFPRQIVLILSKCIKNGREENEANYFCTFSVQKSECLTTERLGDLEGEVPHVDEENGLRRFIPKYACLQVYEKGSFRNLLHLQLDFYELDDLSVKHRLLSEVRHYQKECEALKLKIEEHSESITEHTGRLESRDRQISEIEESKTIEVRKLTELLESERQDVKGIKRELEDVSSENIKLATEVRDKEKKLHEYVNDRKEYESKMQKLLDRVAKLDKDLGVATAHQQHAEADNQKLEAKVVKLEQKLETIEKTHCKYIRLCISNI